MFRARVHAVVEIYLDGLLVERLVHRRLSLQMLLGGTGSSMTLEGAFGVVA